jgi:bacterioferritin
MRNNADIIDLLNKDIEDEHGAIIQYLNHAYAIGEGELACEIEAIAREEMRHLDLLARTIVILGGIPSLKRGKQILNGEKVEEWMNDDAHLEEGAIRQYQQHIKLISDPRIKRILERILSDEVSHHHDFVHFVKKATKENLKDIRGDRKDKLTDDLNWGIEHEYTVILQYLLQSYMSKDEETKKELEDQAINEMQHMGWLAETLVGKRGNPLLHHVEVNKNTKHNEMLKADIEIENIVAERYSKSAKNTKDGDAKELFKRMAYHERYHAEVFSNLLKEE